MIHRIVIGDWSRDGHGQMDFYNFECNAEEPTIKQAYFDACKKSGIYLHRPERGEIGRSICSEYQNNNILDSDIVALKRLGIDLEDLIEDGRLFQKGVVKLFLEMVKSQIPGFEYTLLKQQHCLNGFWSKDFNFQMGYGCY